MKLAETTVITTEIEKFAELAQEWWDPNGAFKTLHHINSTRLQFIQHHTTLSEKRVLDVGCGGGILTEVMAKAGAQVTGIDAEEKAIHIAKAHAKTQNLFIDYQIIPIESLKTEPFDVITCMEMLEHVTNPSLIIQHCARLLKPGGILFLSTINRTAIAYVQVILAAEYILNLLPRQTHDYHKFITPAELSTIIRKHNLELLDLQGMAYNPLTKTASLRGSVAVNYLIACRIEPCSSV